MQTNFHMGARLLLLPACMLIFVILACGNREDQTSPSTMMDRAVELRQQGKFQESIPLIEAIVLHTERTFGSRSQQYAEALWWLANGRANLMELSLADSLYFLSESIFARFSGSDTVLAKVYIEHARMKIVQQDWDIAEELTKRAYDLFTRHFSACNHNVQEVLLVQSDQFMMRNDLAKSIPYLEAYLACNLTSPLNDDSLVFSRARHLLNLYAVTGKFGEAERLGLELINEADSIKSKCSTVFTGVYFDLGKLYNRQKLYPLATTYLDDGMLLSRNSGDTLTAEFVESLRLYAQILNENMDFRGAREYYEKAFRLAQLEQEDLHDEIRRSREDLARFYREQGEDSLAAEIDSQSVD